VREQLEAAGYNMLLVNVSGPPRRVLEVLGLTDWFSMERAGARPVAGVRAQQTARPPVSGTRPRDVPDAVHVIDLREASGPRPTLNGVG